MRLTKYHPAYYAVLAVVAYVLTLVAVHVVVLLVR